MQQKIEYALCKQTCLPNEFAKTKKVLFTKCNSPMAMSHHDKYSHIDKEKAITWSESIVGMTPPSKKNMCNKVKILFIHD